MAEPKVFEVAPQVITREKDIEGNPQLKAVVKEMRKDLGKKEWARAAELAANAVNVDYEGFAKKTASFGVDIDENATSQDFGKVKLTDDEKKWADQVKNGEEFARAFFELGYDGLKKEHKDALRASIIDQAKRIPLVAERVNEMDQDKKDAFALRLIKDPTFTGELKNIYNELLSKDFTNDLVERFEDWQAAKDAKKIVDEEFKVIQAQTANAESRLNSFKRKADGSPEDTAANAKRVDLLRNNPDDPNDNPQTRKQNIIIKEQALINAQALVARLESEQSQALNLSMQNQKVDPELFGAKRRADNLRIEIANIEKTLPEDATKANAVDVRNLTKLKSALEKEISLIDDLNKNQGGAPGMESYSTVGGTLNTARETVSTLGGELAALRGKEAELAALEEEERVAQERVKAIKTEEREVLQRQLIEAQKEQRAKRSYEEAKQTRLSDEEILAGQIEKAGGTAAAAIMADEIREVTGSFDAMFEKVKKGSQSMHEDALYVTLQNAWLGPEKTRKMEGMWGKRKKETVRPLSKAQVLADYNILLRDGDVALARSLMKRTANPDTSTPGNPVNFTDDEIDDIFDKNPDLVAKFKPEAIKQLLARKAMVGGFTPEDTYILNSTAWGRDAVTQAYQQNENFRHLIDLHMGEGALKRHGFWQRFGQEMAKHPFWWSILLGIPAIFKTTGAEANRDTLDAQRAA